MDRLSETPGPGNAGRHPLLRRLDQAAVAVLLAASLLLIGIPAWLRHRQSQGLIEIDRAPPTAIDFRVDINQAGWPELALLPGVGETLARRIVESRDSDGPFRAAGDLLRVPGIGPSKLEEIAPYLLPLPAVQDERLHDVPLSGNAIHPRSPAPVERQRTNSCRALMSHDVASPSPDLSPDLSPNLPPHPDLSSPSLAIAPVELRRYLEVS